MTEPLDPRTVATTDHESAFHKSIIDNLYDGVYYVDLERRITYWNSGAERITGYTPEEAIGQRCWENLLMHVDAEGRKLCLTMCPLSETMADGRLREVSVYLQHKDGHRQPVNVRASPIRDPLGKIIGAVEIFTDDSKADEATHQIAELQRLALIDLLTEVANRRYLEMSVRSKLDDFRRYGFPIGVLFVDIDHFKAVNDDLGHHVGDAILRSVAATLQAGVREGDIVGRWGGDEFVVLVLNADPLRLTSVAERCRALVRAASIQVGDERRRVTISIGATLAEQADTPTRLIARADRVMYQSKEDGRDRVTVG